MTLNPTALRRLSTGFTLIELMVGMVLGLLVLFAVTTVFVNVSGNRHEIERTGRQIENGRYALSLFRDDLTNAGYFGEFDPREVGPPAAMPDPCSTAIADLKANVLVHIQGYDRSATKPLCLTDVQANTPVLVVRRAATCIAQPVDPGCDPASPGNIYVQSTLCNSEIANPVVATHYVVAAQPSAGASPFSLTQRDCKTAASVRAYVMHIYFIAKNNNPGDGIPTLKRAELSNGAFTIVPLVEGIESVNFEYGVDGTNGNGSPSAISADPSTLVGVAGTGCSTLVACWTDVMTVQVHVLSRATEVSPGYADVKSYSMGWKADGSELVLGPFNDGYKRHAYVETIRLNNPAGRRE